MKNKIILYCIGCAGSDGKYFESWIERLDSNIVLRRLVLNGRGNKSDMSCDESVEKAAESLLIEMKKDKFFEFEYVIVGHSIGVIIVYELERLIECNGLKKPKKLFFIGRSVNTNQPIHHLPEREFLEKIKQLGGIPSLLDENPKFLKLFSKCIRNDVKIAEKYKVSKSINNDVILIYSRNENLDNNDFEKWEKVINGKCKVYKFDETHFSVVNKESALLNVINMYCNEF